MSDLIDAAIERMRAEAEGILARATSEDRIAVERALKRLGSEHILALTAANPEPHAKNIAFLLNGLGFVKVRYQIEATAVVRTFLDTLWEGAVTFGIDFATNGLSALLRIKPQPPTR